MTLSHHLCFILLLCPVLSAGSLSADVLRLDGSAWQNPVVGMQLYEDISGLAPFNVIRTLSDDSFARVGREMLNFSHHESAYWGRFQVETEAHAQRLLEVDNPQIDSITIYAVHGADVITRTSGDLMLFRERPLNHRNFVFPMSFEPGRTDVYIRFQSRGSLFIGMSLSTPAAFASADYHSQFVFGIYYGIFAVMLFFNLLIFLAVKDTGYILYVLYIASYGAFQFALNGFAYQYLWPESPFLANFLIPILGGLAQFTAFMFTRVFLKLETTAPLLNKTCLALMSLTALGIIVSAATDYTTAIRVSVFTSITFAIIAPVCAVAALRSGFRPARFFLLAWSFFFIGIVVFALFITGVIPGSILTKYALQAGAATELVMLSFALGDRLQSLREEKEAAQALALEEQKQRSQLTSTMNERLEAEVKRKTADLNQALGDLKERESKMQIELRLAQDIQKGLMPPEKIQLRNINVVTYQRFLTQVGGDFADVVPIRGGRLGILIADVSGHGIPAALVTTMAKLSFAQHSAEHHLPSRILSGVNNQLVPSISSLAHLTAFMLVLDRHNNVMYSAAAHHEPIIYRRATGKLELWNAQGFILGCMPDTGKFYFDTKERLHSGDRIMLYTDGMTDCRNNQTESGQEFGLARLQDAFERSCSQTLEEARAAVAFEFEDYVKDNADDDASFLIAEITGS